MREEGERRGGERVRVERRRGRTWQWKKNCPIYFIYLCILSYTFIYFYIPANTPKCFYIPAYTPIYFKISNVKNMRTNIRYKNGHNSGSKASPRVRPRGRRWVGGERG